MATSSQDFALASPTSVLIRLFKASDRVNASSLFLACSYGPTIALIFVLAVAAIKAIVEDKKRHDEDRKTNNTTAHLILEDGKLFRLTMHFNSMAYKYLPKRSSKSHKESSKQYNAVIT